MWGLPRFSMGVCIRCERQSYHLCMRARRRRGMNDSHSESDVKSSARHSLTLSVSALFDLASTTTRGTSLALCTLVVNLHTHARRKTGACKFGARGRAHRANSAHMHARVHARAKIKLCSHNRPINCSTIAFGFSTVETRQLRGDCWRGSWLVDLRVAGYSDDSNQIK